MWHIQYRYFLIIYLIDIKVYSVGASRTFLNTRKCNLIVQVLTCQDVSFLILSALYTQTYIYQTFCKTDFSTYVCMYISIHIQHGMAIQKVLNLCICIFCLRHPHILLHMPIINMYQSMFCSFQSINSSHTQSVQCTVPHIYIFIQ